MREGQLAERNRACALPPGEPDEVVEVRSDIQRRWRRRACSPSAREHDCVVLEGYDSVSSQVLTEGEEELS